MMRGRARWTLAWGIVGVLLATPVAAAVDDSEVARLRGAATAKRVRVIARLKETAAADRIRGAVSEQSLRGRMAGRGVAQMRRLGELPFVALEVDGGQLEALAASDEVITLSEDRRLRPTLAQSVPQIGAPTVWKAGFRGKGRAVAILDTGVDATHPFLKGRVVAEACFSAPGTSDSFCRDRRSGPRAAGARPCEEWGCEHGTHVAGIAAGKGSRFSGVAPEARIVAVQVFSRSNDMVECEGFTPCIVANESDLIEALDYVAGIARTRHIDAVNMSLSGEGPTGACDREPIKEAIDKLLRRGVATIIASGNLSKSNSAGYPGCVSTAITVGATSGTNREKVASFSNIGSEVDLLAPGDSITSSIPGGFFTALSGTSMAAPHVTGAFALLRSAVPSATVARIETVLEQTGKPFTRGFTRPRIDVAKAFTALRNSRSAAF